jgi:hypothetical protein
MVDTTLKITTFLFLITPWVFADLAAARTHGVVHLSRVEEWKQQKGVVGGE